MPLNYRTVRTVYGPTENKLKKRNNTVREVFNAKGIPRNMGNKEILGRVKVYNNLMTTEPERGLGLGDREGVRKISDFVTNGRVFNQRKRKALAKLMLRFDDAWGGHMLEILALENENVIRYIKYMADFFGVLGFPMPIDPHWAPHYIVNLTYKKRRGPIREDPGAVRVLKKRTAFIKELLKVQVKPPTPPTTNSAVWIRDLPRNIRNKISLTYHRNYMGERDIWRYMQKEFPLPPHPKNAATKIQAAVRGMRNRKKLTTMRKAATTIQKRVRGMINRTTVKKMKTVAGKRKRSPSV